MPANDPSSSELVPTPFVSAVGGPTKPARPPRRWLRFSLRTFLLLVTVLCIWLGLKVNEALRQKRAVEALEALGAQIAYAHQRVKNGFDTKIDLNVPSWARAVLGDDFFRTVTSVSFLPRFTEDRNETLPYSITDNDLACLADLPWLEQFFVVDAPISDAGVAHLANPDRLLRFVAVSTHIGDATLKRLALATRLDRIQVDDTRITDEGLLALGGLENLKILGLGDTRISDEGLEVIREMTALEYLVLARTDITNTGLAHLRESNKLMILYLHGTRVTDEGLVHLHGLPMLSRVLLNETQVTPEGIAKLKAASPWTMIVQGP
jgi:hypothetical protein